MTINSFQRYGSVREQFIQLILGREFFHFPIVLVPTPSHNPTLLHTRSVRLHPGQHLLLRGCAHQVRVGQPLGVAHKVGVRVHQARHHHRTPKVYFPRGGILVEDGALRTDFHNAPVPDRDGLGFRVGFIHGEHESIVQDEVRRGAAETTTTERQAGDGEHRTERKETKREHAGKFAHRLHSALGFWMRGRRKRTVSPSSSATGSTRAGTSSSVAPDRWSARLPLNRS